MVAGPVPADAPAAGARRPVTQLFTDLEGSTRLWERAPEAMRGALAAHDALARRVVATHGGAVVKTVGDGLHAVFADAAAALAATIEFQVGLAALAAAHALPLRARCGLHTGVCEARSMSSNRSMVSVAQPSVPIERRLSTGSTTQTSAAMSSPRRKAAVLVAVMAPVGEATVVWTASSRTR